MIARKLGVRRQMVSEWIALRTNADSGKGSKKPKKRKPDARVMSGLSEPEKKAFVVAANWVRRNLSHEQKEDLRKTMKVVALSLAEEGSTQEVITRLLGVARNTVSEWLKQYCRSRHCF